ncbi:hypothetical protein BGZ65_009478 [Modicella reniformis]|uniref:Carboxylesterase type B domain-containing protein n=1 Tax=Modicella reniformis TaxID=1440133 RepID=A0A9P6J4A9_9FUNG|nr:hypothetical protein BGZ65_009478 [Modicella reniformis]
MSGDDHHPQITIPGYGTIQGVSDRRQPVARFMNIPFGSIPQRWKPAVRPQPWTGVRDASKQGSMPPQEIIDGPSSFLLETLETCIGKYEDLYDEANCLNLNIFMPSQAVSKSDSDTESAKSLPVFIWVYGGALRRGGNGVNLFDATNFVARSISLGRPLIVVVPNYRINYLGFISSKELIIDAASTGSSSHKQSVGNWGFQDLILALEWVHSHIHQFSGDKSKVTLAGESAGAVCVNNLMLIKGAQNLFQRAILQSGSVGMLPPMHAEKDGQLYFDHLWKKFGTDKDNNEDVSVQEKVEILRRVPAKTLAEELNTYEVTFFRPTIDGVLIEDNFWSRDSRSRLDQGLQWVLAGCCRDEGTVLVPVLGANTLGKFNSLRSRLCSPSSFSEFDHLYGIPKSDAEASAISVQLINDGFFRFPIFQTSQFVLEHRACHLSRFHFDSSLEEIAKGDSTVGAHHGSDLLFMFGSDTVLQHLTEKEKVLARQMQEMWIEFITAPDPAQSWIPKVHSLEAYRSSSSKDEGVAEGNRMVDGDATDDEPTTLEDVRFAGQNQAIWFKDDLTVGRTTVERLTEEKLAFWKRASEYHVPEEANGRSSTEVWFNLFKMLE